jgi:hypothetical protein
MSVWGFGSHYRNLSPKDKTQNFIDDGCAYIGWNETEAPALYHMLDTIKVGDIVYIKSFAKKTKKLNVKAIGLVLDNNKRKSNLGTGVKVKWLDNFKPFSIDITKEMYRNNVFNNTLYEEYNVEIINELINRLISKQ